MSLFDDRLYEMFKKEHPETVGEKDQCFDTGNYAEWLETYVLKLENKLRLKSNEHEETLRRNDSDRTI